MSDLKSQLIKIGTSHPHLQPHLQEILDGMGTGKISSKSFERDLKQAVHAQAGRMAKDWENVNTDFPTNEIYINLANYSIPMEKSLTSDPLS